MKKTILIPFIGMMLFLQYGQGQARKQQWLESFDGSSLPNNWQSTPNHSWRTDAVYALPNASANPHACYGAVPNQMGDSTTLTTDVYDFSLNGGYGSIYLRFWNICKISPSDEARLEYRILNAGGGTWEAVPASAYRGYGKYTAAGFNAASYADWQAKDSMAMPAASWWKEELFDLSFETGYSPVQFRFVIKHGTVKGTQVSYGWLLEDLEVFAAQSPTGQPPTVHFVPPFVMDEVHSVGVHEINARIKSNALSRIRETYLKWSSDNWLSADSVPMNMLRGDTLWQAFIPTHALGTTIAYTVTGIDADSNKASATTGFHIAMPSNTGQNSVMLKQILSPTQATAIAGQNNAVSVTIRNKGSNILASCDIHWRLNGVLQPVYQWNGNLQWDMEDTIVLSNTYSPRHGLFDTITAWVSLPNGVNDSIKYDDTLGVSIFGCNGIMQGSYTIGANKDFPTLEAAMTSLAYCIAGGDIRFMLESGNYSQEWNFTNTTWNGIDYGKSMGNYRLTITSETGNRNDVTINSASTGALVTLNNIKNLTFESLTFGRKTNAPVVYFTGGCTNLIINNCQLLGDTSTNNNISATTGNPLYKANGTGIVNGFRLSNSLLEGGYYNAFFSGGTNNAIGSLGTNIVWDSNVFKGAYAYALNPYYCYFTSISHNTFLSRTEYNGTSWYGLQTAAGCHVEDIIGNRVIQMPTVSTTLNYIYGIYLATTNQTVTIPNRRPTVISNNEVIGNALSSTASYGINLSMTGQSTDPPIYVLHNTVFFTGTGAARGIFFTSVPAGQLNVVKNNIVQVRGASASAAYPIYLGTAFNTTLYDIDANNMYATGSPNYIGYNGSAISTLTAWKAAITTDKTSLNLNTSSNFTDTASILKSHLKLNSYAGMACLRNPLVINDFEGRQRDHITVWGCYHDTSITVPQVDGKLENITGLKERGAIIGQQDTVKVELQNMGLQPLTDATICWTENGTTQHTASWSGYLEIGDKATVVLGTFQYIFGTNTIEAVLCGLGTQTDQNAVNDTARLSKWVCGSPYSGDYAIPEYFTTYAHFVDSACICGVNGDITLKLRGTFTQNLDLSTLDYMDGHHLTLISADNHPDSAVFKPVTGVAATLKSVNNLTLEALTFNGRTTGTYCVQFVDGCTNIVMRNCKLLSDTTTTIAAVTPLYKSNTGVTENFRMVGCLLEGGYYNTQFYGGTGNSMTGLAKNVVWDSNTFRCGYLYAIYPYYTYFTSMSHNTFTNRTINNGANFYMLHTNLGCHFEDVIGNRCIQRPTASTTINYTYGIYFGSANLNTVLPNRRPTVIANNEVIVSSPASNTSYGIYIGSSGKATDPPIYVLHNSVYISGTGASQGIALINIPAGQMNVVKKNIACVTGSAATPAYPIYLGIPFNPSLHDIDENNMYAFGTPNYVGYNSTAIPSLAAWKNIVTSDQKSVNIAPQFINPANNLQISSPNGLFCTTDNLVTNDVDNTPRLGLTTMGCYDAMPNLTTNLMAIQLLGLRDGLVLGQSDSLKMVVFNMGNTPVNSANIEWSVNGNLQIVGGQHIASTKTIVKGEFDTLTFGEITYTAGILDIKAWLNGVNGGSADDINEDDTLTATCFVCKGMIDTLIRIGTSGDFPTVTAALNTASLCGTTGGNVTLVIDSGMYVENINLTDIGNIIGNYSFTITSASGRAEDVVIAPASDAGITLSNSNNVIIKSITVKVDTLACSAIRFMGACTNVVIRDCRLLGNPNTTINDVGNAPISKAIGTGIADSIFFINNLLDGGYYGWLFYAGTSADNYGLHIVFDSNTVSNQYYYGTYPYYSSFVSCNYNTILSRIVNTSTYWYPLNMRYVNGNAVGNRIIQRSNAILYPYGIYSSNHNQQTNSTRGLIANNELILSTSTNNYGIYATYNNVDCYHNSIYISGTGGSRGIYLYNNANMDIRNNNIVLTHPDAHPIYYLAGNFTSNYNNLYAPQYVGYHGGNISSMTAWQQQVPSDSNSVQILPDFVDVANSLELRDYDSLYCDSLIAVDIRHKNRKQPSTMGCHEETPYNVNASLINITGIREGVIVNQMDTIRILIKNMGKTPLDSLELNWKLNGVLQNPKTVYFSPSLNKSRTSTQILGTITYLAGTYNITAWISSLNDGTIQDEDHAEDTISVSGYVCSAAFAGTVTIGQTGTYQTINEVLEKIKICGAGNDITLSLESGLYTEVCNLTDFNQYMNGYSLTIVSATNTAEDVIITPPYTADAGIILRNSNNLIIKAITVDASPYSNMPAMLFTGSCTNVLVRDCRLLAHATTSSTTSAPVYKGFNTGKTDNIAFINNLMDGGCYGWHFYGGTSINTGDYGTRILFDSNIVSNQHYYGISPFYVDFTSCNHNSILSRLTGVNSNPIWYALRMNYANGEAVGNRIIQRSTSITQPYGIYSYFHNYYNQGSQQGLLANNEIILYTTGAYYGIAAYYSDVDIIHNSVYISGTGAARGIFVGNYANVNASRNNVSLTAQSAYPIYHSGGTYIGDYNNLHAPQYIGYRNGDITTMTAWQAANANCDLHSVRTSPAFIDPDSNLEIASHTGLRCPQDLLIKTDIRDSIRGLFTTIGCYSLGQFLDSNATLLTVLGLKQNVIAGDKDTLQAVLYNSGMEDIHAVEIEWENNGVSQGTILKNYSPPLSSGQFDTILLGELQYLLGSNNIKIWINELNSGNLTDEYPQDDTLSISVFTCSGLLVGTVNISKTSTYTTIQEALDALTMCGIVGDIVFELDTGTYVENMNLTNINKYMKGYSLTFASASGNADDVIIRPPANAGSSILINNANNLTIIGITVDVRGLNSIPAIQITSTCSNLLVRDCKLLGSLSNTSSAASNSVIYKPVSSGVTHNISFIHNLIDGGYYGWYFYGGYDTASYGNNIVFDSNTVSNQYFHATYPYYVNFASCNYNTLLSRTSNSYIMWYALRMYYSNGEAIGNRIVLRSSDIRYAYGITSNYHNYYGKPTTRGLIANNEIIMQGASDYFGIHANYSNADIYHNSIYIIGNSGACGIYISEPANLDIKNNNIVMTNPSAYPIYYHSGTINSNCNNLYAPTYVGYHGGNVSSMSAWKQLVPSEQNSVRIMPDFINPANNLKMTNPKGLLAFANPLVNSDIDKTSRGGLVTLGCYEMINTPLNASLLEIAGLRQGYIAGQTDTVKALIFNSGVTTPITSLNLEWSIDGVSQGDADYNVSIAIAQSDLISLGTITYPNRNAEVKVWINNVNGITDGEQQDDTLNRVIPICTGTYSGVIPIGEHGMFKTIDEAFNNLTVCGVSGDISFAFETGIYDISLNISDILTILNGYRLTLTSLAAAADSVIFRPANSSNGITLGNTNNLTISDITIDLRTNLANHGIFFEASCSNILIRDCKILHDTTTTITSHSGIYKNTSTGILSDVSIVNNLFEGGNYGIYCHAGTATDYGTAIVFDSNTVTNAGNTAVLFAYAELASCSYNKISNRTTHALTGGNNWDSTWTGLNLAHASGNIFGNRISSTAAVSRPCGMYLSYYDAGIIANNEIRFANADNHSNFGLYAASKVKAKIINNSIYMRNGYPNGIYNDAPSETHIILKNNHIDVAGNDTSVDAYGIYYNGNGYLYQYQSEFNNIETRKYTGRYNYLDVVSLADWQSVTGFDLNSTGYNGISNPADYDDISNSLEFNTVTFDNSAYRCPVYKEVETDINGRIRMGNTTKGAYEQAYLPDFYDLAVLQIPQTETEVINNQNITVGIDVKNVGLVTLDSAVFGWSLNGQNQPAISHLFTTPLAWQDEQHVPITVFTVNGNVGDQINIAVWVETINGKQDTVLYNNTASANYLILPFAKFVEPLVPSVTEQLSFDVHAYIYELSGATISTPKMLVRTIVDKCNLDDYDTVAMVKNNNVWTANIPPQYYGSKIIYSLHLADTIGNQIDLVDSTQIVFSVGGDSVIVIGTATNTSLLNPFAYDYNYSYSRNYYRAYEIEPKKRGGTIKSIAFYNISGVISDVDRIAFYMKAVTDSVNTSVAYIDPIADGATLVWGQATASHGGVPGWQTFQLSVPFFLPPNMNLLLYCDNQNNNLFGNGASIWQYTPQSINTSVYVIGNVSFPPTGASYINGNRPNMKLEMMQVSQPYAGYALSLTSVVSPVNSAGNICEDVFTPVKVTLTNMGNNEYDFTKDSIRIDYEVIAPDTLYSGYLSIDTGKLEFGEDKVIELMPTMPLTAGQYGIKAWVTSPADGFTCDDTVVSIYRSGKIYFPYEEYFAAADMPKELISEPDLGGNIWEVLYPVPNTYPVQPDSVGTGILQYTGGKGSMATVKTRQIDMYKTVLPKLEFWYYHDANVQPTDNSYTDVIVYADGTETVMLNVRKKSTVTGWQRYEVDLSPYTTAQCVYIAFEAMNMSSANAGQYIDHIAISSSQDLSLTELTLTNVSACNFTTNELKIKRTTTTNQQIDFSRYQSAIQVDIKGTTNYSYTYPLTDILQGDTFDIITLAVDIPFSAGIYTVTAYLTAPVDVFSPNDTARLILNLNPDIEAKVINLTGGMTNTYCLPAGMEIYPEITLSNKGNLDISEDIPLTFDIWGETGILHTLRDTVRGLFQAGTSMRWTFKDKYIVPSEELYNPSIKAELACDVYIANNTHDIVECVDLSDVEVVQLLSPADVFDVVGTEINLEVQLKNNSPSMTFPAVTLNAVISGQGFNEIRLTEQISNFARGTRDVRFASSYTVPSAATYTIQVYVDKIDPYTHNDTLKPAVIRSTNLGVPAIDLNGLYLGQNMPNPAQERTLVEYRIPEDGQVIFSVYSIAGQILHLEKREAYAGINRIEFNTGNLAEGVYYYSMEYKGERLVKKMEIRK